MYKTKKKYDINIVFELKQNKHEPGVEFNQLPS